MLIDGVKLVDGSKITNQNIESGAVFPTSPVQGRVFYLTAQQGPNALGLYVYDGSAWVTGDISSVNAGTGLTGGGTAGAITLSIDTSAVLAKTGDTLSGNLAAPTGTKFTMADAPSAGIDLVNKNYVDSALAGLSWKASVRAISTSNITTSGNQTVDGVALVSGNRVLVAGQTTSSQNGIYIVSNSAWARSTDANTSAKLTSLAVFVEEGTVNADTAWTCSAQNITVGTTSLPFVQFNGTAGVTAGVGLVKTGNTLAVALGAGIAQLPTNEVGIDLYASTSGLILTTNGSTASTASDAQLSLSNTGVTAGTYTSVTVDAKGRVTAGSNPSSGGGADLQSAYDYASNAANILMNTTNPTLTLKQGVGISGGTNVLQIRNASNSIVFAVNGNGIISGSYNGNAGSATTSTHLSGGQGGNLVYQTAAGATGYVGNGANLQWLMSNGNSAPSWTTLTFAAVTNKPSTLGGYGITDAVSANNASFGGDINVNSNNMANIKTVTLITPPIATSTSGNVTINWTQSMSWRQNEPTGAITYTFTAPAGPCHLQLYVFSDGTSTAQTFTWPASVIWFGVQWAAANNKKAIINFWYDGTNYLAMGVNQV